MNTPKIHLTEQNFQSQHSGKCNLLIRISNQRLSYAIVDQGNDQLKVLFDSPVKKDPDAIKILMQQDHFLKFHFHKIKISVETSKFTFIPKEVYAEPDVDSYALFIHPGTQSDVLVKDIRSAKVKNIVAIDKHLKEFLTVFFTRPNIFNQANPLIESALKVYRNANTTLLLQFNAGSFEALILENSCFKYYNLFSIDSPDELNYFLLAIIQELELKNTETQTVLCGDISEHDESYRRVQKYFSNISFADSNKLIRHSEIFNEVPAHQFFSLIGLNICE
jgi:hypothetical protein